MRQILGGFAGPLKLGTMNQGLTHFILDDHWANHFARLAAQQGGGAMTVKRLRALIDQPRPMGLPREVENLIILACAAQADRTISLRGAPVRGSIERLDDDAELLEQPLPDETTWTKARERAAEVFGLVPSEVRKGATVARLASELREKAQAARAPLATLTSVLRTRMAAAGVTPENAPRMITILSASVLVSELTADVAPLAVVQALATSRPSDQRSRRRALTFNCPRPRVISNVLRVGCSCPLPLRYPTIDVRQPSRLGDLSPKLWRRTNTSSLLRRGCAKLSGMPTVCWQRQRQVAAGREPVLVGHLPLADGGDGRPAGGGLANGNSGQVPEVLEQRDLGGAST